MSSFSMLFEDHVKIGDTKINHPTLNDIKSISEVSYGDFIRTFCAKPFDLFESLYDSGMDYEEIGEYEIFNMLFTSSYYGDIEFIETFNIFFDTYYKSKDIDVNTGKNIVKYKLVLPEEVDGELIYSLIDENGIKEEIINKDNFKDIQKTIKAMTGYENKTAPKFSDKTSKDVILRFMVEKAKKIREGRNNNSLITMADLIGAVVLDTSYTYETVKQMNLYQFHSCTRMILKRDEYRNVMTGIYSGSLDPSKVNMEKVYWLNKN